MQAPGPSEGLSWVWRLAEDLGYRRGMHKLVLGITCVLVVGCAVVPAGGNGEDVRNYTEKTELITISVLLGASKEIEEWGEPMVVSVVALDDVTKRAEVTVGLGPKSVTRRRLLTVGEPVVDDSEDARVELFLVDVQSNRAIFGFFAPAYD